MKLIEIRMRWLAVIALSWSVVACSAKSDVVHAPTLEGPVVGKISLDVYKSPTCGCCGKWVAHVEASGFEAAVHHPTDLNKLKADKGISPRYQSCHTAVSQDGYVFEGHIPADVIQRFLANPPSNAIGLAVPGMPVGSPGMEMGNRHDEYDVLLLSKDGSNKVFEHIGGNS
jgi:hypothetical protein